MTDEMDRSMEVDVLASLLRGDQRESSDYLDHLAAKLEAALPEWTSVERKGGLFSKHKPVQRIAVEIGDARYSLVRDKHGPVARRTKIVRGVDLASKELSLEDWTAQLAEAIKELARKSAAAREALERFVLGE
jgi:hypothetical protein